jgi:four helix bundle protein
MFSTNDDIRYNYINNYLTVSGMIIADQHIGGTNMHESISGPVKQGEDISASGKQEKRAVARFETLWVWQKAHSLRIKISDICKSLPVEEKYRIKDQIIRSSNSVADNIAEGNSGFYYNDKIKGYYQARKEAGETQSHLINMESKKYINKDQLSCMMGEYEEIIRGLNGLIRSVSEKRTSNNEKGSRYLGKRS